MCSVVASNLLLVWFWLSMPVSEFLVAVAALSGDVDIPQWYGTRGEIRCIGTEK